MDGNFSIADIASVVDNNRDGFMGGNGLLIILFLIIMMNGGWNRQGEFGQWATASSQNEILLGQKFEGLDNKIDRGFTSIGNGISDATFALNNAVKDGNNMVAGTVIAESRGIQDKLCEIKTAIHAEGEATRALIQQNKIDELQQKINSLEMSQQMNNVVRYPNGWTYNAGTSPFCGCNNGCCN